MIGVQWSRNILRRWSCGSWANTQRELSTRVKYADSPERIRNIGIIAHIDAGKTTTTERMLFYSGVVNSIGDVDEGSTVTDFLQDERERGITIQSASVAFNWKSHQINLVDTPGHVDFTLEVERALRVMDGTVAIIEGVTGVQSQTETVWRQADHYQLPRVLYVNKMDREGADFYKAVGTVKERLSGNALVLQYPLLDSDRKLTGTVNLITKQVIAYDDADEYGVRPRMFPLSEINDDDIIKAVSTEREKFLESLADYDDDMMEQLLESDTVAEDEIEAALRRVVHARKAFPVLCGASLRNRGVHALLNSVVDYLPSPLAHNRVTVEKHDGHHETIQASKNSHGAALSFKVTHDKHLGPLVFIRVYSGEFASRHAVYNVTQKRKEFPHKFLRVFADKIEETSTASFGGIYAVTGLKFARTGDTLTVASQNFHAELKSIPVPEAVFYVAIEGETQMDEEKLMQTLAIMQREDPSLVMRVNKETGQTLLGGMGELHLEIVSTRLRRDHKIDLRVGEPRVSYREKPLGRHELEHNYDHHFGSSRLSATLKLQIDVLEDATRNICDVSGAVKELDDEKIESIRDGVMSALDAGPKIGLPMIGTRVKVFGYSGEQDHLTAEALQACAASAVRAALINVGTELVEPFMSLEITVPEKHVADIVKDLNRRRASLESVDPLSSQSYTPSSRITSIAPLQTLVGYSTSIRSLTRGSANFSMHFLKYDSPDEHVQAQILKEVRGY